MDFVLTPGPGTDVDYDYVDFRAQISVPPAAPTTFAAWQQQNFTAAEYIDPNISGDTATPAHDGMPNLIKYSANSGPKASNLDARPSLGVATIGTDKYLTLSYRKAPSPTDLTYTTEIHAGSLASGVWVAGGIPVGTPVSNSDGTQTITIRDEVPISPSIKGRFMRLRVDRP